MYPQVITTPTINAITHVFIIRCYRLTTNGLTLQYLTNSKALKTEEDTEVVKIMTSLLHHNNSYI